MSKHQHHHRTTQYFFVGRSIGATQNGLALVGDYLSAAAFLGSIAMYFAQGMDSLFYAVATHIGWVLLLILFAAKLRQHEFYTFSDIVNHGFNSRRLKLLSATTSVLISMFYLLVQLMGAATLLALLLPLNYFGALLCVGVLSGALVLLGGMRATTLVQSVKALLLFAFAIVMVVLVLHSHDGSLTTLMARAGELSAQGVFQPSPAIASGVEQVSLILGLVLGLLGLPHILMRFFTVKDEKTALYSAAGATLLIAVFFTFNLIIGFGAYVLLHGQVLEGGNNMALLHLAQLLGGESFQWILAVLVLVTVLAVIAGLVMAASATISYDLLPLLLPNHPRQMALARLSVVAVFVASIGLAYLFRGMNLAFLFGIAFAWVASAHFPVMFGRFYSKSMTEQGAFYSLLVGALGSLVFIMTSNTVWVNIFGFNSLHPYFSPTLFVLPLSFLMLWVFRRRG